MYHTPSQNDEYNFHYLDKALNIYNNDEKVLLVGDFNQEHYIKPFFYGHQLINLVKEKTSFKNMQNPSCIDLLLTNNSKPRLFVQVIWIVVD